VKLRSWLIWLTAGLFYLFEFIHRVVISVMIPELMDSFNVSVAALGSLSACYFYAYALAQIPVGFLIDRYGTRRLLTLACLLITIGSFLFALTSNLWIAEICRILIGFGSAFAFVGCLKLGSTWFPAHRFAFIVGLTNLLGVTGAVIGGKPMALAVDQFGWRVVMLASAVVGISIALLLWIFIKDSNPNQYIKQSAARNSRMWAKIVIVLRCRQTWFVAALGGFMVAPIATYSELWGVSFLINNYGIERPAAAQITTMTFIGIAVGGPIIGWISDHIRRRKLPMLLGIIGAFSSISCILFWPLLSTTAIYILHFAFGFFTSSMLLCFSLNTEYSAPKIRATTIALTNSVIMAMGASLQTVSGVLLDFSEYNFNLSFTPLIVCYGMALLCICYVRETNCKGAA